MTRIVRRPFREPQPPRESQPPRERQRLLPLRLQCLMAGLLVASLAMAPSPLPSLAASPASVILTGQIQRSHGNRLPGPAGAAPAQPLADREVVVVRGRVEPLQFGDPFLPLDQLKAAVISRGRSDGNGEFRLSIPVPSADQLEITVLMVVDGGYYLNSFGPSGAFASLMLPRSGPQPIRLVDDRDALY